MAEKPAKLPDGIKALSFEDALEQLEEIVSKLESGEVNLEDSIDIYTKGTQLKQHCQNKLQSAQAKIEKISLSSSGEPVGTQPFDADK